MAFNREDLITWNELAPSFQSIIKALQTEITKLTYRLDIMRLVAKLAHFWYLFDRHVNSKTPHPNAINSILRQADTKYKVGDMVYDRKFPGCMLECAAAGTTSEISFYKDHNWYIQDEVYDDFNTIRKINAELTRLHNLIEEHKLSIASHPYASDFLIRQRETTYKVGDTVFNDTIHDITHIFVVQTAGTTAAGTPPTISNPTTVCDLEGADDEIKNLTNKLEQHKNSPNPHPPLSFLYRQPSTTYKVGDKVFIPGQNARYYLECKTAGTTTSSQLSVTIS